MRILNVGSVNIDHVYRVPHLVRPGETLAASDYRVFAGGKGFNQSIALARAGARVAHAGRIGPEGGWLRDTLAAEGVDVARLVMGSEPTGHAIIQVDAGGENAIVIHGGANRALTRADLAAALEGYGPGDWLLAQNETSEVPALLEAAAACGMRIAFNPAPMDAAVSSYPLAHVHLLVVNAVEAQALAGETAPTAIVAALRERFPAVALTLGAAGVHYLEGGQAWYASALPAEAVDTTAAGDTFVGYLLAGLVDHEPAETALRRAVAAAAICVTRAGAEAAIPRRAEAEAAAAAGRVG